MKSHVELSPEWKIVGDLWKSPLHIRNQGEEYLTKHKKEPDAKYERRRQDSVIINEFRAAIETMAGIGFRSDPRPEGVHAEIEALMPDIDLCGNSFWAFNLEHFQEYVRDGNGFLYIETQPLNENAKKKLQAGQTLTLADRDGDRPYWVYYKASQLINCRTEKKGSRSIFTQMTFEEQVTIPDGDFGEKQIVQHRILNIGSYRVMREAENKKGEFTVEFESGTAGLDEIMVIPIAELDTSPPLLTLAMLNLLHYNKTSDYDDICHIVCTPQQVRKYDTKQDAEAAQSDQTASPGVGIKIWGQHSSVTYAEVSGSGMDHARTRYQDVEQQMAKIGVGMLEPNDVASVRTATEVMDTSGQRKSKLAALMRKWQNAIEKALYATAKLINAIKNPGGSKPTIDLENEEERTKMRLKIDYERLTFTLEQLTFFSDLVDSGKLSLATFLEWLPQVADMPPGFDWKKELQKVANMDSIETEDPANPDDQPVNKVKFDGKTGKELENDPT